MDKRQVARVGFNVSLVSAPPAVESMTAHRLKPTQVGCPEIPDTLISNLGTVVVESKTLDLPLADVRDKGLKPLVTTTGVRKINHFSIASKNDDPP